VSLEKKVDFCLAINKNRVTFSGKKARKRDSFGLLFYVYRALAGIRKKRRVLFNRISPRVKTGAYCPLIIAALLV
jgi:hypothetical protein